MMYTGERVRRGERECDRGRENQRGRGREIERESTLPVVRPFGATNFPFPFCSSTNSARIFLRVPLMTSGGTSVSMPMYDISHHFITCVLCVCACVRACVCTGVCMCNVCVCGSACEHAVRRNAEHTVTHKHRTHRAYSAPLRYWCR
jgi:hypothetical protein